jgi:hypothetical protein
VHLKAKNRTEKGRGDKVERLGWAIATMRDFTEA